MVTGWNNTVTLEYIILTKHGGIDMMFKKIVPYKLKRALSMATIAGATLMPASCCKVEQEQEQQPTHDVVVEFDNMNLNEQLNKEKLQKLANDKSVRYIYLMPIKHWDGWVDHNIVALRKGLLQPTIEISPKMRGRGDFDFRLGAASKIPIDSLWFVKNGWTINKNYQK